MKLPPIIVRIAAEGYDVEAVAVALTASGRCPPTAERGCQRVEAECPDCWLAWMRRVSEERARDEQMGKAGL